MNILLSVIVPVYKTRDFLDVCVQSLVQQTYKNLEIILVDDGSPDESGAMCDAWAKKDERIRVIHKENGGLSSARNAGLSIAQGEYVAFVDSDDYLVATAYETALCYLEKNQADSTIFSFNRLIGENQTPFDEQLPQGVWKGEELRTKIIYPLFSVFAQDHHFIPTVWRMVYSRDVIEKNHLQFENERVYLAEDLLFDIDYYSCCQCVAVTMERLYVYRENTVDSFSSRYNPQYWCATKAQHEALTAKCAAHGLAKAECQYRTEAQFLAMMSVSVKKEVKAVKALGRRAVLAHLRETLTDEAAQESLRKYTGPPLPFTLRLFCFLAKYKMVHGLYFLVRVFVLLGLEK